jgi:hypothetical protein
MANETNNVTTPPLIDFTPLDDRGFESLVYDMLVAEGFENLQWRDGGSDGGRDIVATSIDKDRSGYVAESTWYCDAKIYSRGVPFDKIYPTQTRAAAQVPKYLLFAVHPHLTPQCKDELATYEQQERPRYQIRVWEKKDIERRLHSSPDILRRHLPKSWSQDVEMHAYLSEAVTVLEAFQLRVKSVWHTPAQRPSSDLIRLVPKTEGHSFIHQIDLSHKLTENQRAFLRALLSSALHMQRLLSRTFNLPGGQAVLSVGHWEDHPDDCIVVPADVAKIVNEERRDRIGRLLSLLNEKYPDFRESGIAALAEDGAPFDGSVRERIYAVHGAYAKKPVDGLPYSGARELP